MFLTWIIQNKWNLCLESVGLIQRSTKRLESLKLDKYGKVNYYLVLKAYMDAFRCIIAK